MDTKLLGDIKGKCVAALGWHGFSVQKGPGRVVLYEISRHLQVCYLRIFSWR